MSGLAGGQTSSTKTVKAICKKNWMQSSKEASHHWKPYSDMRTNPKKQCSRNPRCKPWANLVLHNGVAKLKHTPNSLDVQRMLPQAHHCLQFNFSCQLFPVFLMGQPWNWGDGYLESNLTQTKRSPQTRMGNTIEWFCSRKSRKYILLRASYLFPYRHWREKRGAVAVTGYKVKTTYIIIYTYNIYIYIYVYTHTHRNYVECLRKRLLNCVHGRTKQGLGPMIPLVHEVHLQLQSKEPNAIKWAIYKLQWTNCNWIYWAQMQQMQYIAMTCNDMQWPMDNGHHETIRARTEVPRCARRPRHVDWRPFWRSQREPHDQQPALESLELGEFKAYLRSLMFFLKTSNGYWMEHVQYLFIIFD